MIDIVKLPCGAEGWIDKDNFVLDVQLVSLFMDLLGVHVHQLKKIKKRRKRN